MTATGQARKETFWRMMMGVAMASFVVSNAFGATLKPESIINADVITVGDIFDDAGPHADYVLAPAPAAGTVKVLNAQDIQRVSDAFGYGWQPANPLEKVVIRRQSNDLDRYDLAPMIEGALAEKMQGQKFETEFDGATLSMRLPDRAEKTAEVGSLSVDAAKGTFRAELVAPSLQNPLVRQTVTGRVHLLTEVPVLKTAVSAGDVITADDIDYVEARAESLPGNIIMSIDKISGMSPRRTLAAGKPVTASDIVMPKVVRKGQLVTMVLKSGMISLTAQGKALQDGAEGDAVRVINTTSNQVVDGVVTGPQMIAVRAPSAGLDG